MKSISKTCLGATLLALFAVTTQAQTVLVTNNTPAFGLSSYDFGPVIISAFYGETNTVPNAAISSTVSFIGVNSTAFGTDSGTSGINDRDTTLGGTNQERLRIVIKAGYYLTNLTWNFSRADGPLATDGVTISGFKSDPGAVFSGGVLTSPAPNYSAGKLNFQISFVSGFLGTIQTVTFTNINATTNATLEIVTSDSDQAAPQFAMRNLTVAVVPTAISTQPVPATRYEQDGTNVFSVVATSPLPLSYQWYKSPAAAVTGGTNATLTIGNLALADAGNYFVVATNSSGASITSSVVSLTVNAWSAPSLTTQPTSATVYIGQPTNFTVVATGSPPWSLSYRWTNGVTPIPGATSNVLTIASATLGDAGSYFVTVTNTQGATASTNAVLTVLDANAADQMLFPTNGFAFLRNNFTGVLGTRFVMGGVDRKVTQLGYYDDGADGLNTSHPVGIFAAGTPPGTGPLLAQVLVPAGTAAPYADGYRWVSLPQALILTNGQTYIIAAGVTNDLTVTGDYWPGEWFVDWNETIIGYGPTTGEVLHYLGLPWPNGPTNTVATPTGRSYGAYNLIAEANNAPVAGNLTVGVAQGGSVTADVVGKFATDPDPTDVVAIISVSSPANGTVSIVGGTNLLYSSTNGVASDSFDYTVSDGIVSDTGTVTVQTYSAEGFNRLSPTGSPLGNGSYALTYLGIPGQNYAIEHATNLIPPIVWTPLTTNQAATNGTLNFNVTPTDPQNYYRTHHVP